jgi:hypothetical protein
MGHTIYAHQTALATLDKIKLIICSIQSRQHKADKDIHTVIITIHEDLT